MAFATAPSELALPAAMETGRSAAPERAKETERNMRAASDDELLCLIGSGDEAAFRLLVERHVDRGYAVALRILRSPADAEDVVQDAFLQVWTRRGEWQPGKAKFSTWLYRVVTNRCIDMLRKPKVEAMEVLPEVADDHCDQMQSLLRDEASRQLTNAMDRLPDQQRIALMLSYTEALSNAEIAEVMDTTVFAVESLLKRGRQKLKQFMRSNGKDVLATFTND
ncbi:RNA polymerase sigma factor [Breoghania sp.]|uniref:RNA polymerase sigma factor n=1 Tax=Breoghania sp. TaxID=2065378 RepID=UPI002AA7B206|nr:RNA polymerase sigma factor [Breoghania sp.]